jgi:hypothetical protein
MRQAMQPMCMSTAAGAIGPTGNGCMAQAGSVAERPHRRARHGCAANAMPDWTVAKVLQRGTMSTKAGRASACGACGRTICTYHRALFSACPRLGRFSCHLFHTSAANCWLLSPFPHVLSHCGPLRACAWRWDGRARRCDRVWGTLLWQAWGMALCKKDGNSDAGC